MIGSPRQCCPCGALDRCGYSCIPEWKEEFQGRPCFVERAMFCCGRAILALSRAACVSDRQYKQKESFHARSSYVPGKANVSKGTKMSPNHEFFY